MHLSVWKKTALACLYFFSSGTGECQERRRPGDARLAGGRREREHIDQRAWLKAFQGWGTTRSGAAVDLPLGRGSGILYWAARA